MSVYWILEKNSNCIIRLTPVNFWQTSKSLLHPTTDQILLMPRKISRFFEILEILEILKRMHLTLGEMATN